MNSLAFNSVAITALAAVALSLPIAATAASAVGNNNDILSLSKLHSLIPLHTSLDDELRSIANGDSSSSSNNDKKSVLLPYQQARCDDDKIGNATKTNMRRRKTTYNDISSTSYSSADQIWATISQQAWNAIEILKEHPSPYLMCTTNANNIQSIFHKELSNNALMLLDSDEGDDDTCFVMTTTKKRAKAAMEYMTAVQPYMDVMKIEAGTIDRVMSDDWSVPFEDLSNNNRTDIVYEAYDNDWERIISLKFAPGFILEGTDKLLEFTNTMMKDIQHMAEIGWFLQGHLVDEYDEVTRQEYKEKSLSGMFSLTSIMINDNSSSKTFLQKNNDRIKFWDDSMKNGLEARHACSAMFSAMAVRPPIVSDDKSDSLYGGGVDLILNPLGGPDSRDHESSSSNGACVVSLIAGLSVHPRVFSIGANVPFYEGWYDAATQRS